jgi:1-aminocyclopropane-1-carboxylate deaminase/D-cysteine desulfhydrase-like pyridoxal-dependent ACC family enzyme
MRGRNMTAPALRSAFPALACALPHISLTALPTPLSEAPAFAHRLGIGSLAIKRDDLTSPIYGGNKVRKLEYLLAGALASGCDTVVTFGATGSNHALATAVFAQRLGLACHAVLVPQPRTPWVAATLRYHLLLGTHLHAARHFNHSREILDEVRSAHPQGPGRVAEIPWGGSNWLGEVGFVDAALELAAQFEEADSPPPDLLYAAAGSMGTVIGLSLGLAVAGLRTRIVAPRVVPFGANAAERIRALVGVANHELHARDEAFPLVAQPGANVEVRDEFFGIGYAEATPEALEAVALMQELEQHRLETTYTGKALACLVADARAGKLAGKRVIFWNTYNSAAYPAEAEKLDTSALPPDFKPYLD